MRLVQPPRPNRAQTRLKRRRGRFVYAAVIALVLFQLLRPLPDVKIELSLPSLPAAEPATLSWPTSGQAAIAVENYGIVASKGSSSPLATASIAKVVTALCVLEKHPLKVGESGPLITIGAADVSYFEDQVAQNGSRLPVYNGEQLSEYQALQALLIPSANNIADTLASWAFGSAQNYQTYANAFLLRNGLVQTHVGSDASGLDPSTVSTAEDLTRLGLIARKNSVVMAIAAQTEVSFPYGGDYRNYNRALGINGINGLKTGNNDQNPGGLLFTADVPFHRETLRLTGAVVGEQSLSAALEASEALVSSAPQNFEQVDYAKAGAKLGTVKTPWGGTAPVRAKTTLSLTRWKGQAMAEKHIVHAIKTDKPAEVGSLAISAGEVQTSTSLVMPNAPKQPSLWWRLTRL